MYITIGLLILAISPAAVGALGTFSQLYAQADGGLDAYKSGLGFGCYDAGVTNSTERYINQPGKQPAYHTEAFMIGYINGFIACDTDFRTDVVLEQKECKQYELPAPVECAKTIRL